MKVTATRIPEVLLIEPRVFGDARGFFLCAQHGRTPAGASPVVS